MKKLLLVSLILLSGILLAACEKKSDDNMDNLSCTSGDDGCEIVVDSVENTGKNVVENQESNVIENQELDKIVDIEECKNVVQKYLDESDKEGKGEEVKEGNNITVDYIGRLDDGTVFDTSVESVARGCGTYNEGRNYDEGLAFEVGAGQMIAGFDKGVEGMKIGQTRTIEIAAKDAYGERDESLVVEINKSDLPNPGMYEEGQTVYIPMTIEIDGISYDITQPGKISKITKDKIIVDTNHELAGKTLIFDITLKEISD